MRKWSYRQIRKLGEDPPDPPQSPRTRGEGLNENRTQGEGIAGCLVVLVLVIVIGVWMVWGG